MTGQMKHICPICGKLWRMIYIPGISQSYIYIAEHCFCPETLEEFQKAFSSGDAQVSYAY